jgi:hypothetical protein
MDDTAHPKSRAVAKPKRWYELGTSRPWRKARPKSTPQTAGDSPSPVTLSGTNLATVSTHDSSLTPIDKGSRKGEPSSSSNGRAVNLDLWERAYDELGADTDNKIWIERYENIVKSIAKDEDIPKHSSVKEQMAAVVRTRMKIMTNRQWVLQWGSKSFNLRQQVDSIVNVIQKVSGIGSKIASLDPCYASIAWTGICIVLPVRNPLSFIYTDMYSLSSTTRSRVS